MVKVCQSTIIEAPVDEVWAILRDFNGHDRWHPAIAFSEIEGGEPVDAVGSVRHFRLNDGGELREQLLALSDYDLSCSYAILESPMAVENYVATLSLTPITDGNLTLAEWQAEFDCAPDREAALMHQIGNGVFQTALSALKHRFGR